MAPDLVDLALQVVDHLRGELVSEDLVQVDPLVTGDGLVGGQLDALLDLRTTLFIYQPQSSRSLERNNIRKQEDIKT